MNNTECRYLIQRRFDGDLEVEEEQALDDFIDQSESCAKFEHQLDQMIQGAEELSLPEDFTPPNPEALARQIQQQLPQQKTSFLTAIANMFGGTKAKPAKKDKSSKPDTKFPHRSKKPRIKEKMDVDDAAISNRLKSLQKTSQQEEYADSREKQSTTSSLGQKLGFESGALMQEESSQLTLAESIKRKIAESQGLSTDEDQGHQVGLMPESDPSFQEDRWSTPPQAESSQTSMPSMPSPSMPMPQNNQMESPIGMTPAANLPSGIPQTGQSQSIKLPDHHPGSSIGLAPPGSGSQVDQAAQSSGQGTEQAGANWGARPPKGAQPGQDDPEWGPPPVHGTWDEPQSQPQSQGSWDTGKQEAATSAWDEGTPAGGAQWGQPSGQVDPQAATGQPSNSWSQPGQTAEVGQNTSWGGAGGQSGADWKQPQAQAIAQTEDSSTSGSWATPQSGKTETPGWGAQAGQTSTDSNADGGWSTPVQSGSSWGVPNQNQAVAGATEAVDTAASGAWATPQSATGQQPEVNAVQPQVGSDPGWASNAQNQQGWQTGQSSTASGAWNIPAQNTGEEVKPAQATGWGTPTQAETESKAPDSWGQAAQNQGASSGWGAAASTVEAPAQAQASPDAQAAPGWQAANTTSGAWGQTAQTDQTNAGWSAQPTNQSGGWGTSAPNQADQSGGAAWGSQPQAVSQPVQAVPEPEQQSFDTGGWGQPGGAGAAIQDAARASAAIEPVPASPQDAGGWGQGPASDNQQASSGSAWGAAPLAGASGPPGWGTPGAVESQDPVQSSGWGQPGVEQGAGSFGQTAQEGARKGSWSIPAEQLDTGSFKAWDESANKAENLSNDMSAAVAPPADRFETPIQERTGSQNSMQDDPQSHWDVPIQEKMKQEAQSQTGGWQEQSNPATAQTNLGDPAQSHWDLPIQEKIKQSDIPMPQQGDAQTPQVMPGFQAPTPGFPLPVPSPQQPPQPVAQAPAADTQSGLFGKPIDDNTIDQIFSNNLGVPADSGPSTPPPVPAAPVAPTAPMAPPPVPGAWGTPPAEVTPAPMQAPPPPQMTNQSFAPPQGIGGGQAMPQAPVISSLPAKNGADQASGPSNQRNSGIFNLDDSAVDQIFQNMGVSNDSQSADQPAPQPVPQPQAAYAQAMQPPAPPFGAPQPPSQLEMPTPVQAPVAPQPPAQQESSGLFNINDSDMDKMFDKVLAAPATPSGATTGSQPGIAPQAMQDTTSSAGGSYGAAQMPPQQSTMTGMGQPPMPPALPTPPMPAPPTMPAIPAPQSAPMAHSVPQVPPPKVEGIGKLDASSDTNDGGSGRIAAIGKFLLDQKDLEKLGKITEADQGDVKMRILTMEASADLQSLLKEIGSQEKVIGSVIVGHDGLLIANTMPEEVDAESMGVWALGVYMNTEHVTKKMGHDRVHQVVSRTPRGYVVIADFGGGLLVTITDGTETSTLIPLMRKITDLVS